MLFRSYAGASARNKDVFVIKSEHHSAMSRQEFAHPEKTYFAKLLDLTPQLDKQLGSQNASNLPIANELNSPPKVLVCVSFV